MSRRVIPGVVALALALATGAPAADFSDPTWPCIQRKVASLSPALMWPYPLKEHTYDAGTEAAVHDLAARMALRRVAIEELEPMVAAFADAHGRDTGLLGHVFMAAFEALARQRQAIMKGIEEYSLSQIALSDRIEATRIEMDRLMKADQPDFDRVDELEEQLAWDERIFTDRAKSLVYVCETPVIVEKRLYAIAQMLARAAEG